MAQSTIHQRIKILIKALNMTSRGFSSAIDSSDSTTRNYIDGRAKPGADYLEKVIRRYTHVNLPWLLTGEGAMFLNAATEPISNNQKNSGGNNINNTTGDATMNVHNVDDCRQALLVSQAANEQLRSQLVDKERIIQLLELQLKK